MLAIRDEADWSLAEACKDLRISRDSWYGLDSALGQTAPLTAILPGRDGIPTNYSKFCE